jgi:hypothetical protein
LICFVQSASHQLVHRAKFPPIRVVSAARKGEDQDNH